MLMPDERAALLAALMQWSAHADPQPVFGFLGSNAWLTPAGVVHAVREGSEDGNAILDFLEAGVRREGLAAVVARLSRHRLPEATAVPMDAPAAPDGRPVASLLAALAPDSERLARELARLSGSGSRPAADDSTA